MASWVSRSFKSLYEPYTQYHGGAYYELINGRLLQTERATRRQLKSRSISRIASVILQSVALDETQVQHDKKIVSEGFESTRGRYPRVWYDP